MYATFGSQVTVVQDLSLLVPREDRDVAAATQQVLENKGVKFVFGAAITGVTSQGNVVTVNYTRRKPESVMAKQCWLPPAVVPTRTGLTWRLPGWKLRPGAQSRPMPD